MACVLTIIINTPGYRAGIETLTFNVPNGSYYQPYIRWRPDITSPSCPSHAGIEMRCPGNQGEISFYAVPTCTDVTIASSSNSCPREEEDPNYDCINGSCTKKDFYNTPGLYKSLSACEEACGTGCSGKCISNSDWAQIEGLSGQLRNRNCS